MSSTTAPVPPTLLTDPLSLTLSGEALANLNQCRQALYAFESEDAYDQPCRADRLRYEHEEAQRQLADAVCALVRAALGE